MLQYAIKQHIEAKWLVLKPFRNTINSTTEWTYAVLSLSEIEDSTQPAEQAPREYGHSYVFLHILTLSIMMN